MAVPYTNTAGARPKTTGKVASLSAIRSTVAPRIGCRTRGDCAVAIEGGRRYTRARAHRRAAQGSNLASRSARRGKQRRGQAEEDGCRGDRQQRGKNQEPSSHLEPPLSKVSLFGHRCVPSGHEPAPSTSTGGDGWGVPLKARVPKVPQAGQILMKSCAKGVPGCETAGTSRLRSPLLPFRATRQDGDEEPIV